MKQFGAAFKIMMIFETEIPKKIVPPGQFLNDDK